MKYYLIMEDKELHIYPVNEDREDVFKVINKGIILATGETVREVLTVFDEMPVIICDAF